MKFVCQPKSTQPSIINNSSCMHGNLIILNPTQLSVLYYLRPKAPRSPSKRFSTSSLSSPKLGIAKPFAPKCAPAPKLPLLADRDNPCP